MSFYRDIVYKTYYIKKRWWRNNRLLFPSPAEVRFIQIFGGTVLIFKNIRHYRTKFPLTIVVSLGRVLRRELIKREVRAGAMYIDYAFVNEYVKRGIEIDGKAWHRDVVREQQRDEYLNNRGWKILHIDAADLYRRPEWVKKRVLMFLSK